MGFIFSFDTLGFLIIGTGILRKIRLGNEIESPPPPSRHLGPLNINYFSFFPLRNLMPNLKIDYQHKKGLSDHSWSQIFQSRISPGIGFSISDLSYFRIFFRCFNRTLINCTRKFPLTNIPHRWQNEVHCNKSM